MMPLLPPPPSYTAYGPAYPTHGMAPPLNPYAGQYHPPPQQFIHLQEEGRNLEAKVERVMIMRTVLKTIVTMTLDPTIVNTMAHMMINETATIMIKEDDSSYLTGLLLFVHHCHFIVD